MSFDNRQIECLRDELMAIIKRRFRHVLNNSVNDYFLSAAYLDIAYRDFKFIDDLEERDLALTKAKDYLINLNEKFSIFVNKDVAPVPVQQVTSQNQFVTPVANNINTTQNTTRTNGSAASLSSNGSATSLSSNGSAASLNSNGSAGNSGNPTINKSTYTPTVTKRRLHSGFLSQILPKQSNDVQRSTLEHEFAQYESISFIISEESAHKFQQRTLSFFKTHKSDLPKLSNLARIILAIPATSVPSESLFSVAGMIQTELRNRLNPACLEMLNFIRSNQNEKFYKKK